MKPFLKWAGGKRWLLDRSEFRLPKFGGGYVEPFVGGGAVFFHLLPPRAILGDANSALIETYRAIQTDWKLVDKILRRHQRNHNDAYYYRERGRAHRVLHERAAQFIYLNRACWNGLYRVNLKGVFNVPRGTKEIVFFPDDDFEAISTALQSVELVAADFELTIERATEGDLVFVDPPYTTAHNFNGFVKYNENIFTWEDQLRLRNAIVRALSRGAMIVMTNAAHRSIRELYGDLETPKLLARRSVISGSVAGRRSTHELLFMLTP